MILIMLINSFKKIEILIYYMFSNYFSNNLELIKISYNKIKNIKVSKEAIDFAIIFIS